MSEPTDKSIAARLDGYRKTLGVGTPAAFAVETIMSKAQKENWITSEQLTAANARVAELERYVKSLAVFDMPPADSVAEWPWQWRMYGIRSEACKLMGIEDQ